MTEREKITAADVKEELFKRELARRRFDYFLRYMYPDYHFTPFHDSYIRILKSFIGGLIKKLMLSVPPQHGKSFLASRFLPAYLLGLDPSIFLALVSYSTGKARRFGSAIKMVMDSEPYRMVFPGTKLPEKTDAYAINTSEIVDILGGPDTGKLLLTGRGGGLTGDPVDVLIMDDLYKNAAEANSPVIRQNVIDWYNMVADSRLHNESRQLMPFTRWHDEDLQGYIEKTEGVINLESWDQLEDVGDRWVKVNFEALKESPKTEVDPREPGVALYPQRHNALNLQAKKKRLLQGNPEDWRCLYMGDPRPITGLLYGAGFNEWQKLPETYTGPYYYGDTADQGADWTCVLSYVVGSDGFIYLTGVYYSPDPVEKTEIEAADFLIKQGVVSGIIESNSGGRQWARNVERELRRRKSTIQVRPKNQAANKESRILTAAGGVMSSILMPENWIAKYPQFAGDLLGFRRLFKANTRDDAPDALTGVYEHSGVNRNFEIIVDIV